MKVRLLASLVLVCLLLGLASAAWAQEPVTGSTAITDQTATPDPPPPVATPAPQSADSGHDVPSDSPGYLPEGLRLEDLAAAAAPTAASPDASAAADGAAQAASDLTPGGFLYVLRGSAGGNFIDRFSADVTSGVLTQLGSTPTGGTGGTGSSAHLLAYDATNYRLYALNDVSNTISAFSVNRSTGWLIPLPFSPIALGAGDWSSLVVHPSGSPLIAANRAPGSFVLASYNITADDTYGVPKIGVSAGASYSTGTLGAFSLAFSQDGAYLYGGGNDGTAFFGFSVNPISGALSTLDGSPYDTGMYYPTSYATDATGRLYLSGYGNGTIKAATTSGGIPTFVASLIATQALMPVDGLVHPAGYYLLASRDLTDPTKNLVGVFKINISDQGTTFSTVSGSPFTTGGLYAQALALSADGKVVYAANAISRTITRFLFKTATGALSSPLITATPPSGVLQGIAYARYNPPPSTGGFLFALRTTGGYNFIDCYSADASGSLALLASTPTNRPASSYTPLHSLAYDPLNARLYVLNDNASAPTVSIYSVDPTSGALSPYPTTPLILPADTYVGLAIHPTGSPLLVIGNNVYSYKITGSGLVQAAGSPYTTGSAYPYDIVFSQDGNYVYTGGNYGTTMAGFSVNPASGALTALAGSPFGMGDMPIAYATDSLGRLFITNAISGSAKVLTTSSGVPSLASTFTGTGLAFSVFGLLHPAGYYLAADRGNNKVGVFRIDGSGAGSTLAAVPGSPFATGGDFTHFLALNETGQVLYTGQKNSGTITRFQFDPFTGALTSLDTSGPAAPESKLRGLVYVAKVTPSSFFYTLNDAASGSLIYGYRLDKITGALSLLSGFPVLTGSLGGGSGWHQMLAVDARNYRLYAVATGSKHLLAYAINPYSGALTAMPFSPYNLGGTNQVESVAVHPGGSPVIVGRANNQIQSLNVTATSISPALGVSSLGGSGNITTLTFTPDGRFLYTGESGVFALSVNQATGELALVPGAPFYTADGILMPGAADSSGRLFTSLFYTGVMRANTLATSGAPSTVMDFALPGLSYCVHSGLHPSGYLVTACYSVNRVASFKVSGSGASTHLLTTGFGGMPSFGDNPSSVKFDRSGRWLVTVNVSSNNLTSYAFDPATGALTPACSQPAGSTGSSSYSTGFDSVPAWPGPYLPIVVR
jgi:6-phosphogluconolactonase